jgi:hypothetical protein
MVTLLQPTQFRFMMWSPVTHPNSIMITKQQYQSQVFSAQTYSPLPAITPAFTFSLFTFSGIFHIHFNEKLL